MGDALYKVANVELIFELQMENFSLVPQLNINVSFLLQNFAQNAVQSVEIIRLHSSFQVSIRGTNCLKTAITATDRSLRQDAVFGFEDPVLGRTPIAEKVTASFTVKLNVTEVKFGTTASLSRTVCRFNTALD